MVMIQTNTNTGCKNFKHVTLSDLQLFQGNWDEVVDDFDAMKLREMLLRGIYAYG